MLETTANMLRSPFLMLLCHAIPLEMHRSMEVWQPMVLYLYKIILTLSIFT